LLYIFWFAVFDSYFLVFSYQDTLTDEDASSALRADDQKEEVKRKRLLVLREKSSSLRDKEVREKLERKLEKEKEMPKETHKSEGRKFSQSIPVEPSVSFTRLMNS
jgi:hypothetical protein